MAENFRVFVEQRLDTPDLVRISADYHGLKLNFEGFLRNFSDEAFQEVFYSAIAQWESLYGTGRLMLPKVSKRYEIEADLRLHSMVAKNWVYMLPPFPSGVIGNPAEIIPPPTGWHLALKDDDLYRFPDYSRAYFESEVWFNNRFETNEIKVFPRVSSLQALCLQKLSLANYMGQSSVGMMARSATADLYPTKIPRLVKKYGDDNVACGLSDPFLRRALHYGIITLFSVMGMQQFFHRQMFKYNYNKLAEMSFPSSSSSGIRRSSKFTWYKDDLEFKVNTTGTKLDQAPYAFYAVNKYVSQLREKDIEPPERLCKIAYKYEVRDLMWEYGAARVKAEGKCREFFIPFFTDFIIANIVFGQRCILERGNTIKVGFRWWFGGAHTLAHELGYPRDDIIYSSGDITGQDYHTIHYLLYMFGMSTLLYISPDSPHFNLYKKLLCNATKYLVAKFVRFFGNMWRGVVGTMPSGHYVTSHANSFIFAHLFWSYVYAVHCRNPKLRILYSYKDERGYHHQAVNKKYFIRFVVYGDNHIMALSKNVNQYLNYSGFEKFIGKFNFFLHDQQYRVPFLSVPSPTGGLQKTGIVFLKRYFIEVSVGGEKYVIPYKTFKDGACKIVFGNSPRYNIVDYLIALIGMAWDYQGTNEYAHNVIARLYHRAHDLYLQEHKMPFDLYMSQLDPTCQSYLLALKLVRKGQMNIEDIVRFPSRSDLVARHRYFPIKHYYRHIPNPDQLLVVDDLEGVRYPNQFPDN